MKHFVHSNSLMNVTETAGGEALSSALLARRAFMRIMVGAPTASTTSGLCCLTPHNVVHATCVRL